MDNPEGSETWEEFVRHAASAISKHTKSDFDELVAHHLDISGLYTEYMVCDKLNIEFQSHSKNIPLVIISTNNIILILEI